MRKGVGALGGLRRTSILAQAVAGAVGLIVLAIGASTLPAFGLIHAQLERQVRDELAHSSATSQALLEAELGRLSNLATLVAERPTLRTLLDDGDTSGLESYLTTFRAGVAVDQIVVRNAAGEVIASDPVASFPLPDDPSAGPRLAALSGSRAGAALIATAGITTGQGGDSVTVLRLLDEAYLAELGEKTGLRYSLVLNGERVATTLPSYPAVVEGSEGEVLAGSEPYFALTTELADSGDGLELESALPIAEMRREERQAMALLGTATLVAAAAVSALGVVVSRRLTRPLKDLTRAAQRIRQGDLETPVPILAGPAEVATLASTLEAGRVQTRTTIEHLMHEKAWSEALIQSVVEGIVTLDRGGRIVTFSPGAERLIGWRSAEAIGQSAGNIFRTPDGSVFLEKLPPAGGRRAVQVVDRAGRTMTLSITDARLRLPSNGGERLALVMRDVSDDEAVRQLRSYFLANISHEFRTPLSAIHASVELLLEDLGTLSREEIAGLLHSVDLSVTGLQTLIDNLLESLSIEAGRFTIRRHASELNKVMEQSVHVMRPLLDRREQTLQLDLPASLPLVWMDPMRVTQVIVNLLSNASKYSPVRSPIELSAGLDDGHTVRVSVADRGEGIAPSDRENLFRRFVRLEPADPGQYGVGLGLSVVKAIVEEHGGRVGVEGRPGGGSVFWFTLPLRGGLA